MTDGERLEHYIGLRWTRKDGGIRELARRLGTSADTVYHWFDGTSSPKARDLENLAKLLGVKRWEIVAAMDGEEVLLPLNDLTREAFVRLMDEWADERGVPRPRREPRRAEAVG